MAASIDLILNAIVALTTLAAAVFFFVSSRIEVRNSQDDFVHDLHRIGKWNGYGALAASIAAFAVFAIWLRSLL
jgi:hypothetical protein